MKVKGTRKTYFQLYKFFPRLCPHTPVQTCFNIVDFRQPNDVQEVDEEVVVNPELKGVEGGGWWDSLYSAAKSKVRSLLIIGCYF